MPTNFPVSLDDGTSLPTKADGVDLITAAETNTQGDAIKALEAKVGIGASTPTASTLLKGTGVGTSAYSAGTPTDVGAQPLDSDLTAIAAIAPANDDVIQRKAGAWTNRTMAQVIADLAALATTFQPLDSDLTGYAALSAAGFVARTGAGTVAVRTLQAPAAGLTISNPAGTAGDPTFALANDLSALEALASTGIPKRTGSDAWAFAAQGTDYYAPGGTDVAIADGGTNASTAAAAATNLGLGTSDSPQFAGVNVGAATDTTIGRTSAGIINVEGKDVYMVGGADSAVADGGTGASTAAAARTNLGLVIGTDVQAFDAELAALAGLTSAANKVPVFSGSGTAALQDFFTAATAWTPVLTAATPGNLNVVYTNQIGAYMRFGPLVFFHCQIVTSTFTWTTASGNILITGLPVTINVGYNSNAPVHAAGWTKAGYGAMSAIMVAGGTSMQLRAQGSAQANAASAIADWPSGGTVSIYVTGCYFA